MHEMALSESMLQIIEDQAAAQNFTRVKRVRLEIGTLAAVDPEALRFCFDVVTRGTAAEGAVLDLLTPPGQAWCLSCSRQIEIAARFDPCPLCGGHCLQVTGGDEMRIKELEVE
jgi:hydrogenase nickel incorporation protein HypA/HybF